MKSEKGEMMKIPIGPVSTVGQMRDKIASLPDDETIHWQVAAEDGSAWSLGADAGTAIDGTIFCVALRHPDLKTLPKDAFADKDQDVDPVEHGKAVYKGYCDTGGNHDYALERAITTALEQERGRIEKAVHTPPLNVDPKTGLTR